VTTAAVVLEWLWHQDKNIGYRQLVFVREGQNLMDMLPFLLDPRLPHLTSAKMLSSLCDIERSILNLIKFVLFEF